MPSYPTRHARLAHRDPRDRSLRTGSIILITLALFAVVIVPTIFTPTPGHDAACLDAGFAPTQCEVSTNE